MNQLLWYVDRLRVMTGGELAYRCRQKLRAIKLERFGPSERVRDIQIPSDFAIPFTLSPVPEHLRVRFAQELTAIAHQAMSAERNVFSLLGLPAKNFGESIDWYTDPVKGQRWPDNVSAFRIDYRHQNALGEVKYVWELGRMPWLLPRAIAAHILGDNRVAQTVLDDILSFIRACPPYRGIHWTSGLELAVRITNWTWALALIQGMVRLTAREWHEISQYIATAADYCLQFQSRFSSANNHLIGEAVALIVAGICWPVFSWHKEATAEGLNILKREVPRQVLSDGSCVEISLQYLKEDLEWSLCAAALLRSRNEQIPEQWTQRWKASARFIRTVSCGDRIPLSADSDDAQILPLGFELTPAQFADVLECAAGCLSPASCSEETQFAAWLLNIPHFQPAADGRRKCEDHSPGKLFLPSGLFVVTGKTSKLIADFAPHGFAPLYAHAHADALSIIISTPQEEILIDPGTFCYHGERRWRDWFRSTNAHNTVELNEENQSEIRGPFLWGRVARTWLEGWSLGPVCECEACHDGYAPIIHKRRIVSRGDDRYLVQDVVFHRENKPCQVNKIAIWWHFSSGELDTGNNRLCWKGRNFECRLSWKSSQPNWAIEHHLGNPDKPQGWFSPRFSVRFPSPVVGIVMRDVELPFSFDTQIEIIELQRLKQKQKQA